MASRTPILLISLLATSAVLAACGGDPSNTEIDVGGDTADTGTDVDPLDVGDDSGDAVADATDTSDSSDSSDTTDAADGSGDTTDAADGSGDTSADVETDSAPDPICGDGEVNREEEDCDGDDLDDATCESLGRLGGELACSETCGFVQDGCYDTLCGNGSVEDGEDCDDGDLDDGDGCSSLCTVCEEDPNEPNTGIDDATSVAYPGSIEDLIAQSGDDDWFRTFVSPGCITNFDVTFEGDPALLTVDVIDFDGTTVLTTAEPNPDGPGLRVVYLDGGDGFIGTAAFMRVRPAEAAQCIPYQVTIRLMCG